MSAPLSTLTELESTRLEHKERVIERGVKSVGDALKDIREERLYRDSHATFEDYCRERWGISRSLAYRRIAAAEVAEILSPMGDMSERQARELAPLRDDPQRMREVWQNASEASNGRPTAEALRVARDPEPPPTPTAAAVTPASSHPRTTPPTPRAPNPSITEFVEASESVQDARYAHEFMKALGRSDFLLFDAERLAQLLEDTDVAVVARHAASAQRFADRITQARSGLRLVVGENK